MKLDVKEDEKAYTVQAEVPGVKKEDIQVDIDGNQVSVRAEVKKEEEEKVDEKSAKAEHKDGVLNLTLPKKANGDGKRISVA